MYRACISICPVTLRAGCVLQVYNSVFIQVLQVYNSGAVSRKLSDPTVGLSERVR
jgi:hypothetical protein